MKKGAIFRSRHTVRIAGLIAGFLLLCMTPLGGGKPAEAAPAPEPTGGGNIVQWINRGTILYDGTYYTDSNTGDLTAEFTANLAAKGGCTAKITFDMLLDETFGGYYSNDYFYYGEDDVATSAANSPTITLPTGKKDAGGNWVCNDVSSFAGLAISLPNRRVTFVKTDDTHIINYKNNIQFVQVSANGVTIPNLYRRADEGEPCKDIIFTEAAMSDDNGDGAGYTAWHEGQVIAGSAILYAVSNNSDAGRWAESYADVYQNNKTCAIDNGDLYNAGTYAAAGNDGGSDYDKTEAFIAKGINQAGTYFRTDKDKKDDTFVIFLGTAADNMPKDANGNASTPGTQAPTLNKQTCKGGALGWIVCPMVSAIQAVSDAIKDAVAAMLKVNPLPLDTTSTVYKVWDNFRTFSNIMFVIVFMIIIFSQATSIGLSSYGIKSMLPRLIAIAILSNLSYYVCSIAIDLFNILGAGIENLFAIANGGQAGTVTINNLTGVLAIGTVGTVIGVSLFTGAIVELFPLIIGAFMAILVVFIVLVVRQALIIMLVVASPVILVLGILPGTRQFATGATEMFMTLLIMYPLIIGLFAAARIASSILTALGST